MNEFDVVLLTAAALASLQFKYVRRQVEKLVKRLKRVQVRVVSGVVSMEFEKDSESVSGSGKAK